MSEMSDRYDSEWTAEERDALRALAREARPSDLLEGRIVRQLTARGLLGRRSRGGAARWAAGIAAALLLFAGGVAVGRWQAFRSAPLTGAGTEVPANAVLAAVRVQQAGSSYVAALAALNEVGVRKDAEAAQALAQGREAAVSVLAAASEELSRMGLRSTPLDGVVSELEAEPAEARQVIWF